MKRNYHLYFRLPYKNAAVGNRNRPTYTVLRSDTEKTVAKCNTIQEAEYMVKKFDKFKTIEKAESWLKNIK